MLNQNTVTIYIMHLLDKSGWIRTESYTEVIRNYISIVLVIMSSDLFMPIIFELKVLPTYYSTIHDVIDLTQNLVHTDW